MTAREAVLTLYLAAGALGVLGLFCVEAGFPENWIVAAAALAVGLIMLYEFEFKAKPKEHT